jgi:flagellin-like hook-associated protein FlgL
MADIILSSAVRSNLLSLQNTASLLGKTQERLATGLKVNSALDDPTAFFTAAGLSARASDLSRLLDSVGLAVQTLEAADSGIKAITDLVEQVQATARQALQSPGATASAATVTGTGASIAADGPATVTGSNAGIGAETDFVTNTAISQSDTLVVNGTTITFGTGGGEVNTGAALEAAIDAITGVTASYSGGQLVITSADADTAVDIGAAGTDAVATALGITETVTNPSNLLTQSVAAQGETLTIQIGTNTSTVTFGTGAGEVSTLAELTAALGTVTGGTASVDATGNITVTAANTADSVTIGGTVTPGGFGLSAGTTAPTAGGTPNAQRTTLETEFNNLLVQIDQLSGDASFNGNNLLQSDALEVFFNESGTSSLTIQGVDFDSGGLGITAIAAGSFQADAGIDAALAELDTAIATLRAQASTFGSNLSVVETRQNFTNELINVLETGAGNLTIADTNEEGANLLALQTRQQLSTVALSLASEADQNVLQLF